MIAVAEFVAVLACLLFTGAATYITFVEHPARLTCSAECALSQWAPSYKRATVMQANLAVIATIAALAAFVGGAGSAWILGGILIFSVVPITLFVIMPTNRVLLEPGRDPRAAATRDLLTRWGRLHSIRSVASSFASITFLLLLLR